MFSKAYLKNVIQIQSAQHSNEESKGKCCPEGSWPALKVDYQPKGNKFKVGETEVYHIGDSNRVLIIFSDIFGAFSGRHQSIADTFAEYGYSVYIPQVLLKPYEQSYGDIMSVIKEQTWQRVQQKFKQLYDYLNKKEQKEFFGMGFCWGVWAGFKFATRYQGFKSFIGYHPSLVLCGFFGQNQKELVQNIKCPAYLFPASNDPLNIKQGGELIQILQKKFGKDLTGSYQFTQQVHGWVVRGDINKPQVYQDVQLAIKLGLQYFDKF